MALLHTNWEEKGRGSSRDENKFKNWLGNVVYFFNSRRKIPVRVVSIRHYENLYQYLDAEGYDKVLPGIKSYQEAVDMYHQFYPDDLIKKAGGMLAIEIELV